jgi:hypothetical protein
MATISNLNVAVARNVANADVTVTYTINWSPFDQATNLGYLEVWDLIGDDTNQDGDTGPAGDDPISLGLTPVFTVSSNGNASTSRSLSKTIAFANLNEDDVAGNTDDEIRATVTLTPQLPTATTRESTNFVQL